MSYSFKVSLDDSGAPVVSDYSGTLLGTLAVNGHEDDRWASVTVTRLDEDGSSFVSASASKSIKPVEVTA